MRSGDALPLQGHTPPLGSPDGPGRRVLALVPDGFGGHGGIAQYSRDLLTAMCLHPEVKEVVALPRVMPHPFVGLPQKLTWQEASLGGKAQYIWTLFQALKRKPRFDLVVCGHINLLPLADFAGRLMHTPRVCFIYGIDAWGPPSSSLTRWAVRRSPAAYASISRLTLDRFQAWAGVRQESEVVPNAIHLESYGSAPKPAYLLDRYDIRGKRVVLTFGRMAGLARAKGFDEILEALPALLAKVPDLVYILAGDGLDLARLKEKAARLGLSGAVRFTGRVPEQEKADHFRLADVYAMPSRGEGFGFVVLEALACGIPVVASAVDGTREALRDGLMGQLVDPDDTAALHQAILQALDQGPGLIPEGLSHFAFPAFTERVHRLMDRWWSGEAP